MLTLSKHRARWSALYACGALAWAASSVAGCAGTVETGLPPGAFARPDDGGGAITGGTGDGKFSGGDGKFSGSDGKFTLGDGGSIAGSPDGGGPRDAAISLGDGAGVHVSDGAAADGSTRCAAAEVCGNGLDDDCNGQVDDGCGCTAGQTQRCYPGDPAQAGVGVCTFGMQACNGGGEFPTWSACSGAGSPQPVTCGGQMDYRCDGVIDEGCACPAGATRPCYDGPSGTDGVGQCHDGLETCVASGSMPAWGPCTGEVLPSADNCDPSDPVDHDCAGGAHSGCACLVGQTMSCYGGPPASEGQGACHAGTQTCVATGPSSAAFGGCQGEVDPAPSDGCSPPDDANCNGTAGDGCMPCFDATMTPWQFYDTPGPVCTATFSVHGDPGEYAYGSIPAAGDPGWQDYPSSVIAFSRPSRLCGTGCDCLNGADFDYWQTSLSIPPNFSVTSLIFDIATVDDGVSITIFNAAYPNGVVDPGSFVELGAAGTSNLAGFIVTGPNRIVMTHVDDCCSTSAVGNATITLNGVNVGTCM